MAFDETLTGGTTSKIIEVMVRDSTTGQGKTGLAHTDVTASYVREGGTRTAISLGSGTAGDSYSSGKWCEVDSTNQKGLYQMHLPDAAIASGVAAVTVSLQATGMIDKAIRIKLQSPVNVTQWRGTEPGALADTDKLPVSVQHMGSDVLGAGNIADNAFSAEHFASAFLTADKIATDAITDNKVAASAVVKIWSQLTSGLSAVTGSFGKLILDNLNATISSRATPTNVSDAQTAIINAVNAVNTGAARYISIHTNAAYEIPDSGSVAYPIEIRTFDADGEPVAIDSAADPTVTVTRTTDAADLSGNLAAISSPATGVYRTTLTITEGTDSVAPLRIDASGDIDTVTRSTSAYPVITDAVAVDFTATDRANLAAILEDTGTTLPAQITLAQNDLDILTGTDGVTLATSQPNYTPLNEAGVRNALGMANADMDTQLGNIQTGVDGITVSSSPTLLQSATILTLASQTSFTLSAGSTDDDAYQNAIAIIVDQSTSTQKTVVNISDYIGSTRTVTLNESPKFTIATGDTVYIVATSKTTLTDDVINSLTGTLVRFNGPVWTGNGWDRPFIKGDSYLGGNKVSITIQNWSGDQLISAANAIKLSGTRTENGTTTPFSWSVTPGNVTVSGTTTTIPIELTSSDTDIEVGEYTADLRATWASPAEVTSLIQPTFKLNIVAPVSTF